MNYDQARNEHVVRQWNSRKVSVPLYLKASEDRCHTVKLAMGLSRVWTERYMSMENMLSKTQGVCDAAFS